MSKKKATQHPTEPSSSANRNDNNNRLRSNSNNYGATDSGNSLSLSSVNISVTKDASSSPHHRRRSSSKRRRSSRSRSPTLVDGSMARSRKRESSTRLITNEQNDSAPGGHANPAFSGTK